MVLAVMATEILVHAEKPHLCGRNPVLVQDSPAVITDLGRGGTLIEAGVGPSLVDSIVAEWPGHDPVER
jgi:hypothetical protein